ncbi:hypothetical protein [Kribbella italica]|uniref:Uncharacterized protein n=1 Tax=Kribbella italica TaxID=1540520 RepID=A0A7W9MS87_9ACTN|nr:hypothetical protein [Kribbella italica]MBB5834466.1 hypothetical protein [Kribbella italica]
MSVATPAPWADRIGRTLLAFDAVATVGAFAYGIGRVLEASDATVQMEFWVTTAYLVFAGLWALLAWRPRQFRGLWELVLAQKIAVTVFAFVLIDTDGASRNAVSDTIMVVTTLAAYFLCRGWLTWRRSGTAEVAEGQLADATR